MFISERRRRRRIALPIAGILIILVGAAVAAFLVLSNRTDDVHRGDEVEFQAPQRPARPVERSEDWPVYHYDVAHTGYLPAKLGPPFKERWVFGGNVLMEFPPIVIGDSLYFIRNNGGVYRLDADTGKVKWKNQIGRLSASSPAYWKGSVFVTSLSGKLDRPEGEQRQARVAEGRSAAARSPRRSSGAGSCTSAPRAATLYALYAKTGRVKWKYNASGAIKASPALSGSTLYFGDYSGRMYAVWARTGRERWSTGTSGIEVRLRGGQLLLDAGGRLRARVRRQHRRQGVLVRRAQRRRSRGRSRPAATCTPPPPSRTCPGRGRPCTSAPTTATCTRSTRAPGRRAGPSAAAGASRAGRRWSGAIVYFADLDSKSTYGVDARTGERVFKRSRGYYNPVISDGRRIYMTGYASVTALDPVKQAGVSSVTLQPWRASSA